MIPNLGRYALYSLNLHDLPASRASVIATWEVVTAAALGWLLFGEALVLPQVVGAPLVCFGIWWIRQPEV
ncbi:MAG TPA: EamA family transporter [Candidatus Methylomirabilis sp.]|nr:EamA family transporter [Candidatus Methylomirabilis sp.]